MSEQRHADRAGGYTHPVMFSVAPMPERQMLTMIHRYPDGTTASVRALVGPEVDYAEWEASWRDRFDVPPPAMPPGAKFYRLLTD